MGASKGGQGKLAAVVVTYNRLDQLKQTIARLLDSPQAELSAIVVVDNASDDGSADWLAMQSDPRLDVLRNTANSGGAGGFEAGLRRAMTKHDPDWIVVMDDDGRPAPGALADFHSLDLIGWDAVAAAVYFPNGEICEMNRPSRNPFWHRRVFLQSVLRMGGRDAFHLAPADYTAGRPRRVDITSFVGLFLSRDAIARAGYPDGRLFVYGDDGIYTLGLSATGGRIAFEPRVAFEHDCSTFAGQRGRFRPLWKVYYYHRNLLLLYRAAAGWLFWPLLVVVIPKWLAKTRHHKGDRLLYLRLLAQALRDGLTGRIGTDHSKLLLQTGNR